nr:MAG TPA: hypothetical protein [Caudoviricetes sp.]
MSFEEKLDKALDRVLLYIIVGLMCILAFVESIR